MAADIANYQEGRLDDISNQLREVQQAQRLTSDAVLRLEGKVMGRLEVEQLVATRVSRDEFNGTVTLINTDIKRIQGGPTSARNWIVLAIAIVSLLLSATCGGASLLIPYLFKK